MVWMPSRRTFPVKAENPQPGSFVPERQCSRKGNARHSSSEHGIYPSAIERQREHGNLFGPKSSFEFCAKRFRFSSQFCTLGFQTKEHLNRHQVGFVLPLQKSPPD